MEKAISMKNFVNAVGLENAARVMSEAGFRLLNYTPRTPEELKNAMKILEKTDLSIYQTHTYCRRFVADDYEGYRKLDLDAVETTANVGAKYFVVHGDKFDFEKDRYSVETSVAYNYEFFAPVVEKAEKLGVKVAFENVIQEQCDVPHFGATAEELSALIDRFDSPSACACWDVGHAAMHYKKYQSNGIEIVGDRIECTHIHDNYMWLEDLHIAPFLGIIDWNDCMPALKNKTKAEVLCLELSPNCKKMPLEVMDSYAAYLYKTCEVLDKID